MPLTRRSFLEIFGIGSAAVAAAAKAPYLPALSAPLVAPECEELPVAEDVDDVPLRPSRTTELEVFLRSRGIRPAHLARESGYSRKHLLLVRMGRIEPTPHCAISIVLAAQRLSREPVGVSHLFDPAVVIATRAERNAVLRELDHYERDVRRCFA